MDDELLDVFDEHGRHLGTKRRGDVHRDGDWHLAFHLWVVRRDGVLFQRRAAAKSSWPGFLDASAAGHLLAGEAVRDGIREAEEELGAAYPFDDLAPLGVHRVAESDRSGTINRELQHVFAVRDERALADWTAFDRVELAGLVLVDHDGFAALGRALAAREDEGVAVPARAWDGERERDVAVAAAEVVPAPYLDAIAVDLRHVAGAV
ncbi:MAG TPA: NUDIX domain-containing protein [Baekduia sp.]|nr:NUDIX domain-containing protein [Baekduia sp.]